MLQKVLKVGNSLGVTLPRDFVVKNKIQAGSEIAIVHTNGSITYSAHAPKVTKYSEISDKDFLDLVNDVESRYKKALDKLADIE